MSAVQADANAETATSKVQVADVEADERDVVPDVGLLLGADREPHRALKARKDEIELAAVQTAQADVAIELAGIQAHREKPSIVDQRHFWLEIVEIMDSDAAQSLGIHRIEHDNLLVNLH